MRATLTTRRRRAALLPLLMFAEAAGKQCPACNITANDGRLYDNVTCSAVAQLIFDGVASCSTVRASECACCNFCGDAAALGAMYHIYANCTPADSVGGASCVQVTLVLSQLGNVWCVHYTCCRTSCPSRPHGLPCRCDAHLLCWVHCRCEVQFLRQLALLIFG